MNFFVNILLFLGPLVIAFFWVKFLWKRVFLMNDSYAPVVKFVYLLVLASLLWTSLATFVVRFDTAMVTY